MIDPKRRTVWEGREPLVIGECDDDGNVVGDPIVVKHGEEIPPRALALLARAHREGRPPLEVPRFGRQAFDPIQVKAAAQVAKEPKP